MRVDSIESPICARYLDLINEVLVFGDKESTLKNINAQIKDQEGVNQAFMECIKEYLETDGIESLSILITVLFNQYKTKLN